MFYQTPRRLVAGKVSVCEGAVPSPLQKHDRLFCVCPNATFNHSKYFFVVWDWRYIGNRLQKTQPNQNLRKHPNIFTAAVSLAVESALRLFFGYKRATTRCRYRHGSL